MQTPRYKHHQDGGVFIASTKYDDVYYATEEGEEVLYLRYGDGYNQYFRVYAATARQIAAGPDSAPELEHSARYRDAVSVLDAMRLHTLQEAARAMLQDAGLSDEVDLAGDEPLTSEAPDAVWLKAWIRVPKTELTLYMEVRDGD